MELAPRTAPRSAAGIGENRLLIPLPTGVLRSIPPRVGACRPTWPRAFVRFTENKVVRNPFLVRHPLRIRAGEGTGRRFQSSVLSETAGAGCRLNRTGLHRRVKTDIPALSRRYQFEPLHWRYGRVWPGGRRAGFRRRPAGSVLAPVG